MIPLETRTTNSSNNPTGRGEVYDGVGEGVTDGVEFIGAETFGVDPVETGEVYLGHDFLWAFAANLLTDSRGSGRETGQGFSERGSSEVGS